MSNNVNVGAGRQSHTTADGLYLERRYIYLEPSLWESLHFVSHKSGLSASQYLASIISAADGHTENKGNNDDRTCAIH